MRALPQPLRYVLLAAGFFALAVAGSVLGTVASAHHVSGLSNLAAALVGIALALVIGMSRMAYITGIRDPSLGRQVTAMVQAMDTGQPVSGEFVAGLRDLVPGSPLTRWKRGRVSITPRSVTWTRRMSGRACDLTGAQYTGERRRDPSYTEMTLTLPGYCKGENVCVISLQAHGTDVEVAAPAQLLAVLRYSLARTAVGAP